jgi:hypothetical protein
MERGGERAQSVDLYAEVVAPSDIMLAFASVPDHLRTQHIGDAVPGTAGVLLGQASD